VIAKWTPGDDELDAVARSLPAPTRDADRIEHERTNVLAQATGLAQHKRSSRLPLVAALATTLAAAAAVLIWLVAAPSDTAAPKEQITALGPAQYERTSAWPDFVVRIDHGRVAIQVWPIAANERFRATTGDAEIEVRGSKLIVGADHSRVTFVSVNEGRAEIRWAQQPVVIVAAGSTWTPPRIVQREPIELAPPGPTQATPPLTAKTEPIAKPKKPRSATAQPPATTSHDVKPTTEAKQIAVAPRAPAQVETAPRPGEADFRAGVAALRAGDAAAATTSFASACAAAQKDALGEDACFWVGAAAKRAGQTSTAREALTRFLAAYPSSGRAGEAAALLGWILYDAGELDAAKSRFELAARDRVPKVKESATKGLEAIKRKQATP
jgi:TolA-binding protein